MVDFDDSLVVGTSTSMSVGLAKSWDAPAFEAEQPMFKTPRGVDARGVSAGCKDAGMTILAGRTPIAFAMRTIFHESGGRELALRGESWVSHLAKTAPMGSFLIAVSPEPRTLLPCPSHAVYVGLRPLRLDLKIPRHPKHSDGARHGVFTSSRALRLAAPRCV